MSHDFSLPLHFHHHKMDGFKEISNKQLRALCNYRNSNAWISSIAHTVVLLLADMLPRRSRFADCPCPRFDHQDCPCPRFDHQDCPCPRFDHQDCPCPRFDHQDCPCPRFDHQD